MKEITEDKGRVRPVVEGDFQCDENGNSTRFYEILSIIGYIKDDGTKIGYISKTDVPIGIPITDTDYWYPFQVIAVPKGDKGDTGADGKSAYDLYIEHGGTITPVEAWLASLQGKDGKDGKDGQPLMLRITQDGQSLEISDDGGHTWYMFEKNFSKLRVLGYLNSVSELPRNADIGDIYGVKLPNEEVEPGHSAYELWINTVKGWNEDYVITKIYDYDTELPSYAADGSTVVVPVKYLTLDKQKVDGYKVYRFDQAKNGWIMILNTAEIFASKEDIVNHGDNVYALVQGDSKKTYHDITNWINGSLDEHNKYQEDLTSIIGTCPIDGSVRELSYNIANGYKADIRILSDVQLDPADIDNPTIVYDTELVEGAGSITIPSNAKSIIVTMKSVNEEEEIPTSAGTMVSMYSIKEEKIILYKRNTGWVYFGTNASITYILVQNVADGTADNILSGKAVKDKFDELELNIELFKEEIEETYGHYEENPEFVRVVLDNDGRLLYGVQSNGNFFFGAGCPSQIQDIITRAVHELNVSINEERARAIQAEQQLNEVKVDKEEGKSLINNDYIEEIENPEFVRVYLDSQKQILWGIRANGDIFYGSGVPSQVIDYINQRIIALSLDEYEDIVRFLDNLEKDDNTLPYLLDQKLDGVPVYSSEYIRAIADSEGKLIEAIKADGTKCIFTDFETLGKIETSVDSSEYIAVKLDAQGKVLDGIKKDGSRYIHNVQSESIDKLKETKVDKEEGKSLSTNDYTNEDKEVVKVHEIVSNPEYIRTETDSNGKVLAGRTPDGTAFENVGFSTLKLFIGKHKVSDADDTEKRLEIKTDGQENIISERKEDGTLVEHVGIETNSLKTKSLILPEDSLKQIDSHISNQVKDKHWYLPEFGKVNIKQEKFYLDKGAWNNYADDVVMIQMYDDTDENAYLRKSLCSFYIKNTLTPTAGGTYDRTSVTQNSVKLELHAGKDVVAVGNKYFAKTLYGEVVVTGTADVSCQVIKATKITDPVTGDVIGYEVNGESTEVVQVTDIPPYKAWKVWKDIEHYCIADIDFGTFYSKTNAPVGIKYQGSGSTGGRKRGFRLTFYKNNTYAKKDKVKIGEMIRLSGYNMKSYYVGKYPVADPVLSALFVEIWESRGKDCYPWNNENTPSNGATGMIKSFPIETWFADEFYGIQYFGLKKDEKNYLLDGTDESGIFVCGGTNTATGWINGTAADWEEEMLDEMSPSTTAAINEFLRYIRGFILGSIEIDGQTVPFENSMLEERINLAGWIDYWIGLQVFWLWDSTHRNVVLHTREDKKKFYPFYYDIDNAFQSGRLNDDFLAWAKNESSLDMSFWEKFVDEYKDFIINRYYELRKSILTAQNIESIYNRYVKGIPDTAIVMEVERWGENNNPKRFIREVPNIKTRLENLDNNHFNL